MYRISGSPKLANLITGNPDSPKGVLTAEMIIGFFEFIFSTPSLTFPIELTRSISLRLRLASPVQRGLMLVTEVECKICTIYISLISLLLDSFLHNRPHGLLEFPRNVSIFLRGLCGLS